MAKTGTVRIGISGWTYKPWRGVFYPKGLAQKQELSYAAEHFPSIEVNGTFYRLQRPESFARWSETTPDDFVFSIKAPRYITHTRRLKNIEVPVANFLASGLLQLGSKLGPILWQFPPQMKFDPNLFEAFLDLLPRNTDEASALAKRHDRKMKGRSYVDGGVRRRLRHAVEVRHESFCAPEFIKLLRRYKVALVCADSVEWPCLMDLTADFVYCRLHGSKELYASGYDAEALARWASRIRSWRRGQEPRDAKRLLNPTKPRQAGRDVFVYFDNDMKVRAPADAGSLAKRLHISRN